MTELISKVLVLLTMLTSEVFSRGAYMSNVSELLGTDGVKLRCSYTTDPGDLVVGVDFFAMNNTDTFVKIAQVLILSDTQGLLPYGDYLFGSANITKVNGLLPEVVLSFDELKCKHERNYMCSLGVYQEAPSPSAPMEIFVQVSPTKPVGLSIIKTPMNVSITTERPSAINSTISENTIDNLSSITTSSYNSSIEHNTTDKSSNESSSKMEGDIITFQCSGNVGKPAGIFIFKKLLEDKIKSTYNATTTDIEKIPGNCSYYRTSYFTFQVTAEDNMAKIRCAVVSPLTGDEMYVDSEELKVQYEVREPSITKYPEKKDYIVGTDISITLTCRSDGNPIPMYHWFKEGTDGQISNNETYTIMDINKTYSGIYTCNASNIINGIIYKTTAHVIVNIINEADTSTSSSSTTGSSSGTEEKSGTLNKNIIYVIIGVCIAVLFFVVIVLIYCLHKRNKKGKNESPENNGSTNNLMHYNSKYMGGSKPDAYDSVNLEGDAPVIASGKKEQNVEDVRKHNEEYLKKQTNEEKNENKSPTSDQPVIYAEVNKATKSKNRQETSNQQDDDDDTYAGSQEGIYDQSGNNRHKENKNAEQFDKIGDIKEQNSTDDAESSVKSNQKGSYVNQALSKGEKQVATVPPISRSSAGSQDYEQTSELTQKGYENVKGTDNTHTSTGQSINQTSF